MNISGDTFHCSPVIPFGKQRQKKSGRGRPTINFTVSVMIPFNGSANENPRTASNRSFLLRVNTEPKVKITRGIIITAIHRYRTGT